MDGQESHTFWQAGFEDTHYSLGNGGAWCAPGDMVSDLHSPDVCTSYL